VLQFLYFCFSYLVQHGVVYAYLDDSPSIHGKC
jgi:hypothetical protein